MKLSLEMGLALTVLLKWTLFVKAIRNKLPHGPA